MKPNHPNVLVRGDMTGERVQMRIDEESMAHIVRILTDIYADPELAVIREYSTNAWDAHRMAGHSEPIHVTLPTDWNPKFVVRDFGPGLTEDEIRAVYSSYGKSTKQATNDAVGMLGIGCKSGLTYTSQVMVTSFVKGRRIESIMTRDDEGAPVINILSNTPTDERDGVQITIPVKNVYSFNTKARDFFRFWDANDVLIDGEKPTPIQMDEVVSNIYVTSEANANYVVMGNVPYRVSEGLSVKLPYSQNLIAKVDIGEVDFPPSREELYYSKTTLDKLAQISDLYTSHIESKAKADIAQASTPSEALKAIAKWSDFVKVDSWGSLTSWNSVNPDGILYTWSTGPYRESVRSGWHSWNWRQRAHEGTLFQIIDFDLAGFSGSHKEKFKHLLKTKGFDFADVNTVVITKDDAFEGWLSDRTFSMDDIRKVKLPKVTTGNGQASVSMVGQYYIWDKNLGRMVKGVPDPNKEGVVYSPAEDVNVGRILDVFPDVQIIRAGRNRWDKLQREFPSVVPAGEYVAGKAAEALDALTDDEQMFLRIPINASRVLRGILEGEVDDPAIKRVIRVAGLKGTPRLTEYQKMLNLASYLDSWRSPKYREGTEINVDSLPDLAYNDKAERVRILNALYYYDQHHAGDTEPASDDAEQAD